MNLRPFPLYTAGFDARGSIPGLNTIHREVLDIHHNELIESMETRDVVCDLLSQGMLGDFHCLQLEYMYPQGKRAANRLLLAFLRKQGSAGYGALQKALAKCGKTDVVARMEQTEREVFGVLGSGMFWKESSAREGRAFTPYTPGGLVGEAGVGPERLVKLERTVEVLARLVSDVVLLPPRAESRPLDPRDRIPSLERQLAALEAALHLEVRDRTEDASQPGVLVPSGKSAGQPPPVPTQTDGLNAMFLADLNQRLHRVETMLAQGSGGSAKPPAPTPTALDLWVNDLEAKVGKLKQLISGLLMRSAQGGQGSPEPSSVTPPALQASAKPPSPPAPQVSPQPSGTPAPQKSPKPSDPPAQKSPKPPDAPAPQKSPETSDKPAPQKSPETSDKPAPQKSPETSDKPAP